MFALTLKKGERIIIGEDGPESLEIELVTVQGSRARLRFCTDKGPDQLPIDRLCVRERKRLDAVRREG